MKIKSIILFFFLISSYSYAQTEIEGDYIVKNVNYIKQGTSVNFPNKGENNVFRVKVIDEENIEFRQTNYKNGKVIFQQVFKAKIKVAPNGYTWKEVWENGELEGSGTITNTTLVINMIERLTNEIQSKWTAFN